MKKITMQGKYQSGLTLTELMITVGLGMGVISSILLGYLATYTSSMNTLAGSRLNQEMSALMGLMVGELRRAGYTANFTTPDFPVDNAFNQAATTSLRVFNSMAGNVNQGATGSGSCIVFAYDRNENGVVDTEELGGFRLNGGVVEMRTAGNVAAPGTCESANNTWVGLTDAGMVTITDLVFSLADSQCLNTREPDLIDNDVDGTIDNPEEADCYATLPVNGSSDITVETRQITITVSGNLTNDAFVRNSLSQNVRVRNDWVRVR
jgi:prepilin peptidase dependent protein B